MKGQLPHLLPEKSCISQDKAWNSINMCQISSADQSMLYHDASELEVSDDLLGGLIS